MRLRRGGHDTTPAAGAVHRLVPAALVLARLSLGPSRWQKPWRRLLSGAQEADALSVGALFSIDDGFVILTMLLRQCNLELLSKLPIPNQQSRCGQARRSPFAFMAIAPKAPAEKAGDGSMVPKSLRVWFVINKSHDKKTAMSVSSERESRWNSPFSRIGFPDSALRHSFRGNEIESSYTHPSWRSSAKGYSSCESRRGIRFRLAPRPIGPFQPTPTRLRRRATAWGFEGANPFGIRVGGLPNSSR
jgi:hypothetical protein